MPIFFVFVPDILHFAPFCIPDDAVGFEPVLLLNAVSPEDENWIRELYPGLVVVSLKSSLSGNQRSQLAHAEVLDALFRIQERPFCIQDPDCFVTETRFWEEIRLDVERDFAAGPFEKKTTTDHRHVLPDTFFLVCNSVAFQTISLKYGTSAREMQRLPRKAQRKISEFGYGTGDYPESFKGSFDTLQVFTVLAQAEGLRFRNIPGAGETIFHIGGTSYLHRGHDLQMSHWDYWPLAATYFTLRILELPGSERFHGRFASQLQEWNSSESLLAWFPEFRQSQRFREIETVLDAVAC